MALQEYKLSQRQAKEFPGQESVTIWQEPNLSGYVVDDEVNGLLVGDMIMSRLNPRYDAEDTGSKERRFLFAITDQHNAYQSVRLAEAGRSSEESRLAPAIGMLGLLADSLPQAGALATDEKERISGILSRAVKGETRAINPDKQQAVLELESCFDLLEKRGTRVGRILRGRVLNAVSLLEDRKEKLRSQADSNIERAGRLRSQIAEDEGVKAKLGELARGGGAIAEQETEFLELARKRHIKPGILTVKNAWYRRGDSDSWQYYQRAQDGFESLYGGLMKPMSTLAAEQIATLKTQPEQTIGQYVLFISDLFDLLSIVEIVGKDYKKLAADLSQKANEVVERILGADFSKAVKAAKEYRFLLRYRTSDHRHPPVEWFAAFPPREQPDIDDIFERFKRA